MAVAIIVSVGLMVLLGVLAWSRIGPAGGVLALPFLVGIVALRGLTATLRIFHSGDEFNYHLPTIRLFARQLPTPDLVHYHDAQPPLFYYVMAVAGKVVGLELWRLRLVEVVISFALAIAVHALLRVRLDQPEPVAVAMALLFVLSPYVLGSSFRVITDNLATLFIVLALSWCLRYGEDQRLSTFAVACGLAACAMLTRQSAAFMLAVLAWCALRRPRSRRARTSALAMAAVSAGPVLALFVAWHGIVPPQGDPTACGLCNGPSGGSGLTIATPELALAGLGLYGLVLFAVPILDALRRASRPPAGGPPRGVLLGGLAAGLLLLAFPDRPGPEAAGLLAAGARHVPVLLGSSLLFWILIPASGAVAVWRAARGRAPMVVVVYSAAFLLGTLAIRHPWQKYVDPFILLGLLMTVRREDFRSRGAWVGAIVLALVFIAYVADPALHPDTPAPARPAADGPSIARPESGRLLLGGFGGPPFPDPLAPSGDRRSPPEI